MPRGEAERKERQDFEDNIKERAEIASEQVKRGEMIGDIWGSEPARIDVKGLSGREILKMCGEEEPFGHQEKRKAMGRSATKSSDELKVSGGEIGDDEGWETDDTTTEKIKANKVTKQAKSGKKKKKQEKSYYGSDDDDLYGGGMFGFSQSEVEELACQFVKPWDDDAADDVLAALRYS